MILPVDVASRFSALLKHSARHFRGMRALDPNRDARSVSGGAHSVADGVTRPRRSQGKRSDEMRQRLARAAFEVIAERGHSAYRTAAVAARAGVSEGAQVHHFATKERLTLAAVEYAFAHASQQTERIIAEGFLAGEDPIDLLIADFRLYFLSDDFWVSLNIALNGSKETDFAQGIREIVLRYRLPVYNRWIDILSDAGWSSADAAEIVRMTAALAGGLGIRTLWDDVVGYLDDTFARWREMVLSTWSHAERY